jgi:hypothetical protein
MKGESMTAKDASTYLRVSVPHVKRLLGLMDRNPLSSTYGCFDRNYWHYKIVDFSNGRQQEAALTLALLYTIKHPLNPYYNQEKIREWSLSAMQFLNTIQNSDGSFNEYYPHEHAFVTTAFVTFAVSEALLLLNEKPPDIVESLVKAGKFLLKRHELDVVNQNLGAAAALQNLYVLTEYEPFHNNAADKVNASLERQSPEGWFYEYGGPDIGYLSVAISYLAHYYRKTKDGPALSSLKKAIYFLSHFIHPDGTAGGEYGSRNTTYLVPDGIEICAQHDGYASYTAGRLRTSFDTGVSPLDLDDRYLCNMLYTYLQAFKAYNPLHEKKVPGSQLFPESGLVVEKGDDYTFVANLKKGGVFKVFSPYQVVSDSGIMGRLSDGKMVSSSFLGSTYTKHGPEYTVNGHLVTVPEQQMTPMKTVIMRTSLSVGRRHVSDLAKHYLRRQLITQKHSIPCSFQRNITLGKTIHIEDIIEGDCTFTSLHLVDHASLIYIPSSRYFQSNELKTHQYLTEDFSEEFNKKKKIVYEREVVTCGDT